MIKNSLYIVALLLILTGCANIESIQTENMQSSLNNIPQKENYNFKVNSLVEFENWIKSDKAKEQDSRAFENLINEYEINKYYLIPEIDNLRIRNIFVDSNSNLINFNYNDPSFRICIEPLSDKKFNNLNINDIEELIKEKYSIEYNVETKIEDHFSNEYSKQLYLIKEVNLKNKIVKVVIKINKSDNENTENIISFLYNDMLIHIIYYEKDGEKFDINILKDLLFEKIFL